MFSLNMHMLVVKHLTYCEIEHLKLSIGFFKLQHRTGPIDVTQTHDMNVQICSTWESLKRTQGHIYILHI